MNRCCIFKYPLSVASGDSSPQGEPWNGRVLFYMQNLFFSLFYIACPKIAAAIYGGPTAFTENAA